MDVGVYSMTCSPFAQKPACDHVEGLNHKISNALSTNGNSVGFMTEGFNETPTESSEENGHDESRDNVASEYHSLAAEVPAISPSLSQAVSYPTPRLDSPSTPMPSSKRTKRSAEGGQGFLPSPSQTPNSGFHFADRPPNTRGVGNTSAKSQLAGGASSDVTENIFDDMDMQSIRDRMLPTLEKIDTSETNLEDSAMKTQSLSQITDYPPENVQNQAAASPRRASISDNLSVISSEEVEPFDDDHINSLKRKHSIASPEVYDSSTPSTTNNSLEAFSSGAHAESATSHSSAGEEDDEDLEAQSPLSQPPSRLTSPSSVQSTEAMDEIGPHEPDYLWSAFTRITPEQRAQVRRTGDHLLLNNLATFLEKCSRTWKVSGFWNAPLWNTSESSEFPPGQDRAEFKTYLLDLQNESDTYDVKLRTARVSLFLFFEREIICERQRGTANTALKRNAVSKLCNSRGLGLAEKRKLHKSFHNEKKIGEYWWWCVSFFGPSFLLRCSKEAGKKISVTLSPNQTRFPLDALIAYVLHEKPQIVEPYAALDAAVIHLLMTGNFPEEFSRQDVETWAVSADTQSDVSLAWRPFSTEAVAEEASFCLHKWVTNTRNRLLTF
ncbi:hypothetical protein N7523_010226 [Penicillium sp. IBT 18751x]|nr:hypothetical protein N7523_010226 [Penicillium sp. IBT 18751x]